MGGREGRSRREEMREGGRKRGGEGERGGVNERRRG
jgi:hypothetical protein